MSVEISFDRVREIQIERQKGLTGSRWIKLYVLDNEGHRHELAFWGGYDVKNGVDYEPELVVEDDVAVRRVHTIHEEDEDA